MSNEVQFEEDKFGMGQKIQQFSAATQAGSSSKMAAWLIKKGIVNSDAGAQGVMIGLVVINIIITIIVIKYFVL